MPPWLQWVLLGLVAGALAKFLVPGRDPPGCIITTALGIAGAVVGGWIGTALGWGDAAGHTFAPRTIALATLGAALLLMAGRVLLGRRR